MRSHLSLLHPSIWDVVDFGMHIPKVGDEDYNSDEAMQISHFNSQAITILFASLCRKEYNKVYRLKSAKEIWNALKTTHGSDKIIRITRMELRRFVDNKGEGPQEIYNQLKFLVNKI